MSGKERGKSKKSSSYQERKAISYQQGSDPPFLAQFKSKLGYREWTVEDKFAKSDDEEEAGCSVEDNRDDIRQMREEERPQVVVVNPSTDLSAEELQKEIEKSREEEDKRKILEGKIVFRKPEKRTTDKEEREKSGKGEKRVRKEREEPTQQQQNRRLLSFGEDDE